MPVAKINAGSMAAIVADVFSLRCIEKDVVVTIDSSDQVQITLRAQGKDRKRDKVYQGPLTELEQAFANYQFVFTHETQLDSANKIIASGKLKSQSLLIDEGILAAIGSTSDTTRGGGRFVYTRVCSTRGPSASLFHGNRGSDGAIMLIFSPSLLIGRLDQMFANKGDGKGLLGAGQASPDARTRKAAVVRDLLLTLKLPTEFNEQGFERLIDFAHLRRIVVKVGDQVTGRITTRGDTGLTTTDATLKSKILRLGGKTRRRELFLLTA